MNTRILIIFVTVLVCSIIGFASIKLLGDYGWSIFITAPLLIGFLPAFLLGKRQKITKNDAFSFSFLTLGISVLCLLVFAIEGLICIVMASPLIFPLVFLGSYLGYKLTQKNKISNSAVSTTLIFLSLLTMSFDSVNTSNNLIQVNTTILINSNIDKVWNNVVTFNKIDEPSDWIFKTGISCPVDATIIGEGVGAIRYCNFTTGSFVEPITNWNKPNLLQFDVVEQPIPMNEFNPFWEIQPPHLKGYFLSQKGQFHLESLNENQTKLVGTTWYKLDIYPQSYWQLWSNFIIHKIHNRVLNHIKNQSEKN